MNPPKISYHSINKIRLMLEQLTTERLLLTPVEQTDLPFVFEGLSHPEVVPFYGVRFDTLEATKSQMDWYAKSMENGTGGTWKIIENESRQSIGIIAFYHYKKEHRKAETGFWLLPQYWKKGYASEALRAVNHFCYHQENIHRLEAFVEVENFASSRVLEKCGYQLEGTMRDCEVKNARFISLLIYGLLM